MNSPLYPQFSTVTLQRKGRALFVTLDNPPVNLMDRAMIRDLRALLDAVSGDSETGCVVFRSANPQFFISHLDLNIVAKGLDAPPPRPTSLSSLQTLFEGYRQLEKATIAVLEGRVNGAGTEFCTSLDMRFAAAGGAWIGQFEVALGLLPGATGSQRLPALAGRARALELILGCDEIDSRTAELYGLVNRTLEPHLLQPFVEDLAARIASFPAQAVALAKKAVDAAVANGVEALLEEAHLAGQLLTTSEAKRRFALFLSLGGQTPSFEAELARRLLDLGRQ